MKCKNCNGSLLKEHVPFLKLGNFYPEEIFICEKCRIVYCPNSPFEKYFSMSYLELLSNGPASTRDVLLKLIIRELFRKE